MANLQTKKKNNDTDADTLELRKDVSMPGYYYRAGIQKTRREWQALFPALKNRWDWNEWFIRISDITPNTEGALRQIAHRVFERHGLRSLSYKEAAIEAMQEAIRQHEKIQEAREQSAGAD